MQLRRRKKTYAVFGEATEVSEMLARRVRRHDRCEVRPGTWLVRSRRQTAAALARKLHINARTMAIVITAEFYAGYADSNVIETLEAWNRDEYGGR